MVKASTKVHPNAVIFLINFSNESFHFLSLSTSPQPTHTHTHPFFYHWLIVGASLIGNFMYPGGGAA